MSRRLLVILALLWLGLAAPAQALTLRTGDEVVLGEHERITDDLYVGGGQVRLLGSTRGDVVVAGGQVELLGPVGGDVVIMGGDVQVRGPVTGDVLVLGGQVRVAAQVGGSVRGLGGEISLAGTTAGDAVLAGGTVRQEADSRVAGDLLLGGGTLAARGQVARTLRARGQELVIGGRVGRAEVQADSLVVEPGARIARGLSYRATSPARFPAGTIQGPVDFNQEAHRFVFPVTGFWVWALLAGMVTALVLAALLPRGATAVVGALRDHPWWALALGFGGVIGWPFFVIFAMITVVGLPLGIFMGGVYLLALYLGWLVGAQALGDLVLSRWCTFRTPRLRWLAASALGVLLLAVLQSVPVVGWLGGMLATFAGVGALAMSLARSQGYGLEPPAAVPAPTP